MTVATLTGRHVLLLLIAFFGTIIAANAVFISLAVKSFPGVETERPFEEGKAFNDKLAARAAGRALGWRASIETAREDQARLELSFVGRSGVPLGGLTVVGALRRPANAAGDQTLMFLEKGGGVYAAEAINAQAGAWILSATATAPTGETLEIRQRIILP